MKHSFLDPFFISRPSLVAGRIYEWTLGAKAGWPHLWSTVEATLID